MNTVVDIEEFQNFNLEYVYELFETYFNNNNSNKKTKFYYNNDENNFIYSVLFSNKIIGFEATSKEEACILSLALMTIINNHGEELIATYDQIATENDEDEITFDKMYKEQLQFAENLEEFDEYQNPIKSKIKYTDDNGKTISINCGNGVIINRDIILKLLQTQLKEKLSKRLQQIFDACD